MATKWGIVCAGRLSHDFANALGALPAEEHEITVIGARKKEKAEAFAEKFGVAKTFEDYEEMAKDDAYDVAYIGTIGPNHYSVGKTFLEAGKNVVIEKPMALTSKQVKELIDLARSKDVFLMEASFTRFLPLFGRVRELLNEEKIGAVKNISMSFGQRNCHMPGRRLGKKEHGGGTVLDFGQACIQLALMVYGSKSKPEKITASCAGINENGVDIGVTVQMLFPKNKTVSFVTDLRVDLPCEATIVGKEGSILLGKMWWCGTDLKVCEGAKESTETFPLPAGAKYSFNSANGQGMAYQAEEVRKCLLEGKKESDLLPLDESLMIAEIAEEINQQIGVTFDDVEPQETEEAAELE